MWGNEFSLEELQAALTERDRFTMVHVTEEIQDLKRDSDPATSASVAAEPAATPPTQGEQLMQRLALLEGLRAYVMHLPGSDGKQARADKEQHP